MRKILLTLFIISIANVSNATVSSLAVNRLTKELYVFEEEKTLGVFWEKVVGEDRIWNEKERYYQNLGYSYTNNPYKLDFLLSVLFLFLIPILNLGFKKFNAPKERNFTLINSCLLAFFLASLKDFIIYLPNFLGWAIVLTSIIFAGICLTLRIYLKKKNVKHNRILIFVTVILGFYLLIEYLKWIV